jgi:hypothetical protein
MTQRRRLAAVATACCGALFAVGALSPWTGGAAGTDGAAGGVHHVGSIPRVGGCGIDLYAVDPVLHVLLDLHENRGGDCATQPTAVTRSLAAFSTATLQQVASVSLRDLGGVRGTVQPVVDPAHHRMYFVSLSQGTGVGSIHDLLDEVDIEALLRARGSMSVQRAADLPAQPPLSTVSAQDPLGTVGDNNANDNMEVSGLAYDAASTSIDLAMTTTQSPTSTDNPGLSTSSNDLYVLELDSASLAQRWMIRVAGVCSTDLSPGAGFTHLGTPVLRTQVGQTTAVLTGCTYFKVGSTLAQNQGQGAMAVAAIPLDAAGSPQAPLEYVGRAGVQGGLALPGAGRLVFAAQPPGSGAASTAAGPTAVLFDAAHGVFVGALTVSSQIALNGGYTLADGGDRLYGVGPTGILVAESDATPVGQGAIYPVYGCFAFSAVADAGNRRLFVVPRTHCLNLQDGNNWPAYSAMQVFEDDTPSALHQASNPDQYTRNVAETPGSTEVTFSGHAAGTVARVNLVGGATSLIDNAALGYYDGFFGGSGLLGPGTGVNGPQDRTTRTLNVGDVRSATLDNYESSANAFAADVDQATAGQMEQDTTVSNPASPGPSASPSPLVAGRPWPFIEAACSSGSSASAKQTRTYQGQTATVVCGNPTTVDTTTGALQLVTDNGVPIGIGAGRVTTTVQRDGSDGLLTTVASSIDGIAIGPVSIGRLSATATCHAHGHPGTAACSYARSIEGVVAKGAPVAGGACDGGNSDPCSTLVTRLNALLQGLVTVRVPGPDAQPDYLSGSPGGYQAVCQREEFEHLQDATLNYDNSLQVPGLEILRVDDSQTSPSRLDIQLGNVEAEDHYGILPLQQGGDNSGGGGVPGSTGGPSEVVTTVTQGPPPAAPKPSTKPPQPPHGFIAAVQQALVRIWDGLRLAWRSKLTGLLILALLLLMGAPLVIGWRRRRLQSALSSVTL